MQNQKKFAPFGINENELESEDLPYWEDIFFPPVKKCFQASPFFWLLKQQIGFFPQIFRQIEKPFLSSAFGFTNKLQVTISHRRPRSLTPFTSPEKSAGNIWFTIHQMLHDINPFQLPIQDVCFG